MTAPHAENDYAGISTAEMAMLATEEADARTKIGRARIKAKTGNKALLKIE